MQARRCVLASKSSSHVPDCSEHESDQVQRLVEQAFGVAKRVAVEVVDGWRVRAVRSPIFLYLQTGFAKADGLG